jgi:UDP-glucuronate decarboxylase
MSNGKRVLITGGAGFLGSHVTDRAMREGFDVYIVDNLYTGTMSNLAHHEGHPRFHFVNHDVQHPFPDTVTKLKFDLIFHLACAASPVHYQNEPIMTTLTCVNGTNNVLKEALRNDCPVLIASTSEVYGDPITHPQVEEDWGNVNCTGIRSCYDEGKRCGEALCFDYHRQHGVKVRVVRIFNTYGPRMLFNDGRIISNFVVQALKNEPITIYGTGEYTRSFQYCDDLVEGFWRLVHHPTETGPVNIGNPEEYSVLDMAKMIKAMVPGSQSEIVFLPAAKDDPKQRRPDISKAQRVLNWNPSVNVADGLRRTMDEFSSRLAKEALAVDRVYVQCNPLLDISAHVDDAFLQKYNLPKAAAGIAMPEQVPVYAAMAALPDVKFIPGGAGLNTARVCQWMLQAPKGAAVTYVGAIGDDANGRLLKMASEKEGVRMAVEYKDAPTGTCAVAIVGKERSLLANLGASAAMDLAYLKSKRITDVIGQSKIFYFTGFTVTLTGEHLLSVVRRAEAVRGLIVLNLSAPFLLQVPPFAAAIRAALPYVDVLVSNDDEAAEFAKFNGWDITDPKEIAQRAVTLEKKNHRPRTVIFTCGPKPTILAQASGVTEVPVPPIAAGKIIDTNGAGDAFVGGFLAGVARGATVVDAIKAGNYAAGVIIQHDGCTFPAKPEFEITV